LERRVSVGILKEIDSYSLLTSSGVWNGGKHIAVPKERIGSLVETQETKHPVRARVFAEV
jgi:hypothetical protein